MFLFGEDDPAGASEVCDVARRELLLFCSHVHWQKEVLGIGRALEEERKIPTVVAHGGGNIQECDYSVCLFIASSIGSSSVPLLACRRRGWQRHPLLLHVFIILLSWILDVDLTMMIWWVSGWRSRLLEMASSARNPDGSNEVCGVASMLTGQDEDERAPACLQPCSLTEGAAWWRALKEEGRYLNEVDSVILPLHHPHHHQQQKHELPTHIAGRAGL